MRVPGRRAMTHMRVPGRRAMTHAMTHEGAGQEGHDS